MLRNNEFQTAHSADRTARKNLQVTTMRYLIIFIENEVSLRCWWPICNTAKSCNKIQRSQNTGESVSRIGFKRVTGEMTWNTGVPVKYGRSGSPTCSVSLTYMYMLLHTIRTVRNMDVVFSQVGCRQSILNEELVNGYKNFNRTMCKIVCTLCWLLHTTQYF